MPNRRVALVTLGCARNETDSDELAGRLTADGWRVVAEPRAADAVVVNTCGFIEAAKQESIDTLLAASDLTSDGRTPAVVAVGCLAERYGSELARALPEANAVIGFDGYATLPALLDDVLAGRPPAPHVPRDRRLRPRSAPGDGEVGVAPASGPRPPRVRLAGGPVASLKLASGCDRRCTFCAIPRFRGPFVSRTPDEVLAEAEWLARDGVREIVLVSENTTSYGKDLGDLRLLERLLSQLAAVDGIARVRLSYLQPAELRPALVEAIATSAGVAPYFDLSFQHASPTVLRRMRRFGDGPRFLALLDEVRHAAPAAGARSNFIVGFPAESATEFAELERFVAAARLDAVGVFRYSDEDGTEAAQQRPKVRSDVARRRYDRLTALAETVTAARAAERVGSAVDVLVERVTAHGGEGRAAHQAPDVDGSVRLRGQGLRVGDLVTAHVTNAVGVDLVAEVA
ncbi:MAG: 30S ribosomal protein S12 methylthiotransferase RimO [Mycobacteriales bacterium]